MSGGLHSGAPDSVRVDLPAVPSPSSSSALRIGPQLLWAPAASFLLILPRWPLPCSQEGSHHVPDCSGMHISKHIVTYVCTVCTLWWQNKETVWINPCSILCHCYLYHQKTRTMVLKIIVEKFKPYVLDLKKEMQRVVVRFILVQFKLSQ